MASKYQHRGVAPSEKTASALRNLIAQYGDWEMSRRYDHTRLTLARVAAGLPVNPVTLRAIEERLQQDAADRST